MKRLIPLLLVLMLPMVGAVEVVKDVEAVKDVQVSYPVPMPPPVDFKNLTKLIISPNFKHLRLKPGDSASFTVKIKNPTDKDVLIDPKVVVKPHAENAIDESWVSFDKSGFVLKSKQETEITVTVKVPKDAEKGYYYCEIAFTNETIPRTPYEMPNYINKIDLSVEVWVPPSVKIIPRYINDYVEAGKTYEYTIKIKNTAGKTFKLNPEFVEPEYISGFENYLSKDNVRIEAPSTIPPNSEVEVKVKVNVPVTAKGFLRGAIKLNIDDPGLDEWMQRVEITLNVFTKPTEPFVKTVRIENASKLTVKVSSNFMGIPFPIIVGSKGYTEGDFDVKIYSPSGIISVKPKTIEKLIVTTGSKYVPPWEETEGIYKVVSVSKTKIYMIENPENGIWKIEVMPKNCFGFSIEVEIE